MCAQGVGPLIQCDEIINATKYIDIMKEVMTPENINHLFSDGLFHFQNDNSSVPTASITQKLVPKSNVANNSLALTIAIQ